jgi:hypothetical protein
MLQGRALRCHQSGGMRSTMRKASAEAFRAHPRAQGAAELPPWASEKLGPSMAFAGQISICYFRTLFQVFQMPGPRPVQIMDVKPELVELFSSRLRKLSTMACSTTGGQRTSHSESVECTQRTRDWTNAAGLSGQR